MKNGKKVLLPTKRQLEKMNAAQAVLPYQDGKGNTSIKMTAGHIAYLMSFWKKFTAKERAEILERGEATADYVNLRQYQIYMDERKGIIHNDKDDPKFKLHLEKMMENWKHTPIEHYLMFDSKNRFIGWNKGDEKSVDSLFWTGSLIGGHTMHNHPTTRDRPLGLPFSAKDLEAIIGEGTKTFEVTSREGAYTIELSGKPKFTTQDVREWDTQLLARKQAIFKVMIDKGYRDPTQTDTYWRLRFLEHHDHMQAFAKKFGFKYTFKARKKYSDLDKQSSMTKDLPLITNWDA